MTAYWFKPKRYGWGTTPVTWQGWAVTLAAVIVMVAASLYLRPTFRNDGPRAALIGFDAAVIAALVAVSRRKTEGEWRWRWGD